MDNRIALSNSSSLIFPSMTVTVECEIGRGSNSIVYRGTYPDLQSDVPHHILIKELFPLHPQSLIYRENNGSIFYENAESFFEFHKSSFEKGNCVHLGLLEHSPDGVGGNINTFAYNNTLYTILNYNGGRSLEDEMVSNECSLERIVRSMKGLLLALKDFHQNGFLHLDIAPDNVMLLGSGERERVMLIDYNSTMSMNSDQSHYSIKPGYSSPEVQLGDVINFSPASDLYSVAAVFLRWIRGYALMPFEAAQKNPPSVSECKILKNLPQTVVSMVKQILYRGLSTRPERRYSSIDDMLTAFEELDDRIHGVGITHWALWEAGKRTVNHLIKNNTALHYLNNSEELFPIYAESKNGDRTPIESCIEEMLNGSSNIFVTAPGGMGKTTSMLYSLKQNSMRYSPLSPAIIYIPLRGNASTRSNYITDKILENLQFKSDVQNYNEARHSLHQLFSKPLRKGDTSRPTAALFLDGLNEVTEGLDVILSEIALLSKLEGVRIYITSRTEYELEEFSYRRLSLLSIKEEQQILTNHHLLLPDLFEMQELLRTPIMLSMFLELSRESQTQPSAKTKEELIEAYIESLIQKEVASLPEDDPLRLKIDVAVHLVLPKIAAKMERMGRPANDVVLLKEVTSCYKLIRSRILIKAFPQWIGHKRTILGETDSCDDWYDVIVRELLWRRLGMLIKDEQGQYITVHQIVGDYLADKHKNVKRRVALYRAMKHGLTTVACAVLASAAILTGIHYYPKPQAEVPKTPYNENLAIQVLTSGVTAYQRAGYQYEYLHDLIDVSINDPTNYQNAFDHYKYLMSTTFPMIQGSQISGQETFVNSLLQSGEVFSFTNQPLEKEEYLELISLTQNRLKEYEEIVNALDYMMNDPYVRSQYGTEYLTMVSNLIELDADITAVLYAMSCRSHVNVMIDNFYLSDDVSKNLDAKNLSGALTANSLQNKHLPELESITALNDMLKVLTGQRDELYYNLQSQGAYIIYGNQKANA